MGSKNNQHVWNLLTSNRQPNDSDVHAIQDARLFGLTLINHPSEMKKYPRLAIQVGKVVDMIPVQEKEVVENNYQKLKTKYMDSLNEISPKLKEIVDLKAKIVEVQTEKEELQILLDTTIAEKNSNAMQIEELNTTKLAMSQQIRALKAKIKNLDPEVASKMEKCVTR